MDLPSSNEYYLRHHFSSTYLPKSDSLLTVKPVVKDFKLSFYHGGQEISSYALDNSDVNSTNYSDIILNKNPEFVNVSNNDFNLTESSPAINSGILTSFTNDISGNFRSEPDIGAYEYID